EEGGGRQEPQGDRKHGRPDAAVVRQTLKRHGRSRGALPGHWVLSVLFVLWIFWTPTCWSNPGRMALMNAFSINPPSTPKKLVPAAPTGPSIGAVVATWSFLWLVRIVDATSTALS